MAKELIIMPKWIGDFALALSVVHRKITMQDADVTLLVPPTLIPLCNILAHYKIIPYKKNTRLEHKETIEQIKQQHFDAVFVLPHSFSSAWTAFKSGIKKRSGLTRDMRQFLFTRALPRSIRTYKQHITYEYALVMETDYVPPEYWQGIHIDKSIDYASRVVFCPGSKYGPAKKWEGYKELIEFLQGYQIVVLGDAKDVDVAESLEAASPDRVLSLAGKTSIVDACKIIAGAKLVVANDSGLMHLAGYLGTPVVGIFGSTSPDWTRPLGAKSKIANVKIDCSPCFKRTCRYNHYKCQKQITPEAVSALIRQLFSDRPGSY